MRAFYFFLWLRWVVRVSLCSFILALVSSLFLTFYIYFKQGLPSLSTDVFIALFDIVKFWFPLTWSITLLIALFRSLKYIFNVEVKGYTLKLLDCSSPEEIEVIGYGDLVKVWRRWFMLLIWLSGGQMVIAVGILYLFSIYESVFDWFSIYVLFGFILSSGYLSIILLAGRCKKVKVIKC